MGKSKIKKAKNALEDGSSFNTVELATDSPSPVKAIDGHNTQGWTDGEIKAYNELIVERQKLEKQRLELEEKCAKSQTHRALLHENVANIDSLFKPHNSMAAKFVFTGPSHCCVDTDSTGICDHEICKRAKNDGVSDVELDTIKYYAMRIVTEKSERMRSALRKQRDLELIRIKKEEDEDQEHNAKKASKRTRTTIGDRAKMSSRGMRTKDMGKAAKETEKIVNKIISQLDDLRSDLQTGRISAEEAQGKLNILDSSLPMIQDKNDSSHAPNGGIASMSQQDIRSATELFQNHLREQLLNAKGDTFSQAFSIMDHFLSATKPDDLQVAISELKDVLQLSGPLCDELQNSLGALEGIFDNPEKLSFTGPDGKQECSSIIDLMEKLKETLKRTGQLPEGANASLKKVFQDCIDLEAQAKETLTLKCSDGSASGPELPTVLRQIKDGFVPKSPIPPLTSKTLDTDIANLLDVYDARCLIEKARSGAKAMELEAQITSLVIARTQKKSDRYLEKVERLNIAICSAKEEPHSRMLKDAVANVLTKMKKWIPPPDTIKEKQLPQDIQNKGKINSQPHSSSSSITSRQDLVMKGSSQGVSPNVVSNGTKTKYPSAGAFVQGVRDTAHEAISKAGKYGLWKALNNYLEVGTDVEESMLDKIQIQKAGICEMIEDQAFGVRGTVRNIHKAKACPGLTAVVILQALVEIADQSEEDAQAHMQQFASCIDSLPPAVSTEWGRIFQHIVLASVQLYITTYVEVLAMFPTMSPVYVAINTAAEFTTKVLMISDPQSSFYNAFLMSGYLSACFKDDYSNHVLGIQDANIHYRHFSLNQHFKCTATVSCSEHMKTHPPPKTTITTTGEPPSDSTPQMEKIKPMKTVARYPPGWQPDSKIQTSKADARYAECFKKAMSIYETSCRASLAHLTFQNGMIPGDEGLYAVNELLDVMDKKLGDTGKNWHHTNGNDEIAQIEAPLKLSKFSEHLEESPKTSNLPAKSVPQIRIEEDEALASIDDNYMKEPEAKDEPIKATSLQLQAQSASDESSNHAEESQYVEHQASLPPRGTPEKSVSTVEKKDARQNEHTTNQHEDIKAEDLDTQATTDKAVVDDVDTDHDDNEPYVYIPTTPAHIRMQEMAKRLKAVQGDSRELFETAKLISSFNKDHGKIIQGLAEKMAAQVASYTDFVEQIAGWNEKELTEQNFSFEEHCRKEGVQLTGKK